MRCWDQYSVAQLMHLLCGTIRQAILPALSGVHRPCVRLSPTNRRDEQSAALRHYGPIDVPHSVRAGVPPALQAWQQAPYWPPVPEPQHWQYPPAPGLTARLPDWPWSHCDATAMSQTWRSTVPRENWAWKPTGWRIW